MIDLLTDNRANNEVKGDCRRPMTIPLLAVWFVIATVISGCSGLPTQNLRGTSQLLAVEIHSRIPHSEQAFTQGLEFYRGNLFESTGRRGQSAIRQLDPLTGELIKEKKLAKRYFGEGITFYNNRLYQLTWKAGLCFVYDPVTLTKTGRFRYRGEGWGIQHTETALVMSNGSSDLQFRHPETFDIQKTLRVRDGDVQVQGLNELEVVAGKIFANVLASDKIAVIDSQTGQVESWLDLSTLREDMAEAANARGMGEKHYGVLNGVAYQKESGRLFVTGKNWPFIYIISIVEKPPKDS